MAVAMQSNSGPIDHNEPYPVGRAYAWLVLAMTFGLMLSDYMSRQVINAVFPFLKSEWALSDTQLGMLVGVVGVTVGLLSFPISLVADRVGRVKSATVMALLWGVATIACGYAENFLMMFIARALVGLGEAGYGSAGAAIVVHVFPRRLHATAMGAFLAAAIFGSVLGIVLGGLISAHLGWRMAFVTLGGFGLLLAIAFPFCVKEPPSRHLGENGRMSLRDVLRTLFTTRTAILSYLGIGTAMFVQAAFIAWSASYLNRSYGLEPSRAALGAGLLALMSGIGMVLGGGLADRLSRHNTSMRLWVSVAYCIASGLLLFGAFLLPPGPIQFVLIGAGLLIGAGYPGPTTAVITEVTPSAIHATAFAVTVVCNSLMGMAAGPLVTGWLADQITLPRALHAITAVCFAAAAIYYMAARAHQREVDQGHPSEE